MWLALARLAMAAEQDLGVWSSVNVQADLDAEPATGPRLWTDLHFRRWDTQFLAIARPGLGWDLAKGAAVYVGYAWIPSVGDATAGELLQEHRAWEQGLFSGKAGGVQLGVRPRLEQRFLVGEAGVGHRGRLWGRAAIPLGDAVALAATDEVFVGINALDWTKQGFDQNRLFLGPALATEFGRVEFGYLNVFVDRDTDTLLHAASANLFVNL